jgi:hypothetical protein
MRISILKSDTAVEDQHNEEKGKLLGEIKITIQLFDCNYTSFLKNINHRI